MNFQLAKYEFVFRVIDALRVPPYMGNTLRGGFGHVFRQVACVAKENECKDCMLRHNCVYSYIFETPPPQQSQVPSKVDNPPRPYVIEPPYDGKTLYQPGEEIRFGLVLIGQRAMDYLPYFIFAFDEFSKRGVGFAQNSNDRRRGRCHLEAVYNRKPSCEERSKLPGVSDFIHEQNQTQIFYSKQKVLTDESHPIRFASLVKDDDISIERVRLSFLTRTRIIIDGVLLRELSFLPFIQILIGRISMLASFHCDSSLELDFASLLDRAKTITVENDSLNWKTWWRYSGRQKQRMNWGGLVGELDFVGELSQFLPYIRLGEYVHVGKSATFGLGQYQLKLPTLP